MSNPKQDTVQAAPAKVNLFLHVGDRRSDGYHDLTSLVVFPKIGDEIAAENIPTAADIPGEPGLDPGQTRDPLISSQDSLSSRLLTNGSRLARQAPLGRDDNGRGELGLEIVGPFAERLEADDSNLVLRAAHALRHQALAMGRAVPGAKIVLTKNLPIASGIGGGSADAAATLRVLNELWALNLPRETLRTVGLTLGSDVPVCVASTTQWMEGRGERVVPGPALPEFHIVLVNPGVPVPTGPVFKALTAKSGAARPTAPAAFASVRDFVGWLNAETRNDLQAPAIGIAPPVAETLKTLQAQPGCLLARMSGSGATCFGMFETTSQADDAAGAMPKAWWAKATTV